MLSYNIIIFSVLFSFSILKLLYSFFYCLWLLSWHFHWTIYYKLILKIPFLHGKSNLGACHLIISIVFYCVHHCTFTSTDFICHFIITSFLLQFNCSCFYYFEQMSITSILCLLAAASSAFADDLWMCWTVLKLQKSCMTPFALLGKLI